MRAGWLKNEDGESILEGGTNVGSILARESSWENAWEFRG